MLALIKFEFKKIITHKKSWIGVFTILFLNLLFAIAFFLRNRRSGDEEMSGLEGRLVGEFMNAPVYVQTILAPSVFFLFPVIIAVMCGHLTAGEMETGSLRLTLARPVSRASVFIAKWITLTAYAGIMLLLLGMVSYIIGLLVLNPTGDVLIFGPMFTLSETLLVHPADEAWLRIVLSYFLALPMLATIASLGMMFAIVTKQFAAGVILTTVVYFASYIAGEIPFLSSIHQYLPTRYLAFWKFALVPEIPWTTMTVHAGWTIAYMVIFAVLGISVFNMQNL